MAKKAKQTLFGLLVRTERMAAGMTLDKIAKKVRTHKGYISGIEWGKVNPPAAALTVRYAKALGLPPIDLVELGEIEKAPKILQDRLFAQASGNKVIARARSFIPVEAMPAPVAPGSGSPQNPPYGSVGSPSVQLTGAVTS